MDGLATKRMSMPQSFCLSALYISLMRRLAELRHTALPFLLPAINATRPKWPCFTSEVGSYWFFVKIKVMYLLEILLPHEKSREISEDDFIVGNDTLQQLLNAQTLTSLCSSARYHRTTALGCHARAEAMALCPLSFIRLISTFHDHILTGFTATELEVYI